MYLYIQIVLYAPYFCTFQWSDDEKNSLAQSLSKSFDDVLTSIGFGRSIII